MKNLTTLLVAAAAMAAVNAYAGYTIGTSQSYNANPTTGLGDGTGNGTVNGTPVNAGNTVTGAGGTSTFTFDLTSTWKGTGTASGFGYANLAFAPTTTYASDTAPADIAANGGANYDTQAPTSMFNITGITLDGTALSTSDDSTWSGSHVKIGTVAGQRTAQTEQYTVVVSWSINQGYLGTPDWSSGSPNWEQYFSLDLNGTVHPGTGTVGNEGSIDGTTYITAVPEPGQMIAGGMLLGCGALVFTGRRMMKKRA
jgi:hypothetical protein